MGLAGSGGAMTVGVLAAPAFGSPVSVGLPCSMRRVSVGTRSGRMLAMEGTLAISSRTATTLGGRSAGLMDIIFSMSVLTSSVTLGLTLMEIGQGRRLEDALRSRRGCLAAQGKVERGARREDIHPRVRALERKLLHGGINGISTVAKDGAEFRLVDDLGDTKIKQLELIVGTNHDVGRLQVAVDDGRVLPMQISHDVQQLRQPHQRLGRAQRTAALGVDDFLQTAGVHPLQDHEIVAVFFEQVVQLGQGRMGQELERLVLSSELAEGLVGLGRLTLQDLDGDFSIGVRVILGGYAPKFRPCFPVATILYLCCKTVPGGERVRSAGIGP